MPWRQAGQPAAWKQAFDNMPPLFNSPQFARHAPMAQSSQASANHAAYSAAGLSGSTTAATFFVRVGMTPFAHPLFTSLTGSRLSRTRDE